MGGSGDELSLSTHVHLNWSATVDLSPINASVVQHMKIKLESEGNLRSSYVQRERHHEVGRDVAESSKEGGKQRPR